MKIRNIIMIKWFIILIPFTVEFKWMPKMMTISIIKTIKYDS